MSSSRGYLPVSSVTLLKGLLTVGLITAFLSLGTSRAFYVDALVSPFFAMTLAAALVLHLSVRPWRDAVWVLIATLSLSIFHPDVRHLANPSAVVAIVSFLGLSSLLVMALEVLWCSHAQRPALLKALIPAVALAGSEWSATTLLGITDRLQPKTLDLYLYSFDCSLRIQLSFLIGQLFQRMPLLRVVSLFFYIGLPLTLVIVYAGRLKRKLSAVPLMLAFLVTGPLGVVFYNLFPANGPRYVFSHFPFGGLTIAQAAGLYLEPIAIAGYRNAIPSLHMTWVILAWWGSRGISWTAKLIALAFVVFTILSTLGSGEHYLIDLVVAFPFALTVRAATDYVVELRETRRSLPLGIGLCMTLLWLALLRFANRMFWVSPLVPWLLVASTVIVCVAIERWCYRERHEPIDGREFATDGQEITGGCRDRNSRRLRWNRG